MKWAVGAKGLGLRRAPGGQRVDLQGPSGSRARSQGVKGGPRGSHGVKEWALLVPRGSTGRFDGSSVDVEGIYAYI